MRRGRRRYDPAFISGNETMVLAASADRRLTVFFCGGGGFQWTRRTALRLPLFVRRTIFSENRNSTFRDRALRNGGEEFHTVA